ncbi:glutamate-1-semialdehyde 2,1-aminomutase [Aminipila luticellarii]|uniref:Glutamate-1-semialdehyde 2,1-aminomutase n=1 Tax=Aminipila luticellarii TaxID=2507160 RepID=A0A410PTW2_9FIRM|nr:glutamate-1-semialdehyde 2,1-aminomutase [Aminipila luticellarii]QAT42397.1 glutamate-1-semialdehyde-2,1-aminomutase [Aminipila luticellarii]
MLNNKTDRSERLFEEAKHYIPGGVNSPARAFQAVGTTPRFIEKADAQFIYDADGNKYIDYIGSWGPMILGNNNPGVLKAVQETIVHGLSFGAATGREITMAKLACEMIPCFEMVRMVNSGTEATMSALRTARGYTGRNKIIKFEGCYHGHSDGLLVKAGSALIAEGGSPDSAGVTENCAKDTLTARYNDMDSVEKLFEEYKGDIAAVIIEPVAANMGVVLPQDGFLKNLREICDLHQTVLIFDEVITGFRLAPGGAQQLFGVTPDMATFGKIIGGGMPVGAYGGRRDIMECVAPVGKVYQAGTLSGNPVAMAAGIAQLTCLKENPSVYEHINSLGEMLYGGLKEIIAAAKVDCTVNHIGSIGTLFFTGGQVTDYTSARTSDLKRYAEYFRYMIQHGNYFAPAQFEAMFISDQHTEADIQKTLSDAAVFFGV